VTVVSRGLDADKRGALSRQASVREGDPHDVSFLANVFADADAVINLTGILNERGDRGDGFRHVFVGITEAVIQAMRQTGSRRLLQMSALNAGQGDSHYLQARGQAEAAVRASGLDWTLFRPSVIAGPGDGLFCRFDRLLALAPALPIGRAHARFQPVYVEDVAAAFARALATPASVGQAYDLVGPDMVSLAEIVRLTARARGRQRLVLELPEGLGRWQAELGEWLPGKPISRDNWRSLRLDSVSSHNGLPRLGITPTRVTDRVREFIGADAAVA
jgi:NADH dehydrogenase